MERNGTQASYISNGIEREVINETATIYMVSSHHKTGLPKAELNSHTHKKLTNSPFPGPYTTASYLKMKR